MKAHEADLQRRVDECDDHELDAARDCAAARGAERRCRRRTACAPASGPHRASARVSCRRQCDGDAQHGDQRERRMPADAQREDRQRGARERRAGGHAGLLDRERQRHPRRRRGPREDLRRGRRDRAVADADDRAARRRAPAALAPAIRGTGRDHEERPRRRAARTTCDTRIAPWRSMNMPEARLADHRARVDDADEDADQLGRDAESRPISGASTDVAVAASEV